MKRKRRSLKHRWWSDTLRGHVVRLRNSFVICSDALTLLRELPDQCADVVFLDPPFNLGKRYGSCTDDRDRLDEEDYFHYIGSVISRAAKVLKEGGALWLYHIPRWAVRFAGILHNHLEFRHWIAISMKNGFVRPNRLYPAHYALLYYTKGSPHTFSRPRVSVPTCPHCKKTLKDYGGYKEFVRDGVNLSDIWDDISPVRHKKYKHRDGNELPREIPSRVIQISGVRNGLVVDPFAGTGTSLIVAKEMGMRFVGGDIEQAYVALVRKRLRDMGRPTP